MTAPLAVDPPALAATGGTVNGDGDSIAAAVGSLSSALSGAGAMFGHDAAGLVFGQSYTASGKALLDAAASAVNACRNVGVGVQMSAYNYGRANARSTVGGGESAVPAPTDPGKFTAPSMPPPLGSGIAAPLGWSLVEAFVGDVWPDGDPGQMHSAAAAWRSFGASMTGLAAQVAGTAPALASQQIPEAGKMAEAVGKICAGLANIAVQAQTLATAVDGFAATVDATQNAVRGLLHQLSPGGILETVGGILTGHDPMEKIREVANEIKTVLNNMKREADASSQIFSQGINLLDSETNSLENWAHKEFVEAFGQDVGDAMSFGFTALVDLPEGGFKFLAQTAESLQQFDPTRFAYDPDGATKSWKGMLDATAVLTNPTLLASKIASDPQGSLDTVKGLVDFQDIENGHPFRAVGYNGAQLGTLAIPGVGEADPAIAAAEVETRAAATEVGADGRVAAGAARDATAAAGATSATESVTTQAGRISGDLNNIKVPESSAPTAGPGTSVPGGRAPVDPAPPVEAPRPETPASSGRAPVDSAPPVEAPRTEAPTPPAPQPHGQIETTPPVEAPRTETPSPAPASVSSDLASTAPHMGPISAPAGESLPNVVAGEHVPAAASPGELPPPIGEHSLDTAAPAAGAEDRVPASVGAHSGTGERAADGIASSGGGSEASHGGGSGGGVPHGSGHGGDGPHGGDGGHHGGDSGPGDSHEPGHRHDQHNPVHTHDPSGDGWHRREDDADVPGYGQPLAEHWSSGPYPEIADPNVRQLISDPEAPYGRDTDGSAFTKEQYDERYNKIDDGRNWENYPPNAGAVTGSRVLYDSLGAFERDNGDMLDRIGYESGKYLALMPDGVAETFEARGLPISTLETPYNAYRLGQGEIDPGWSIEISQVAPAFGRDGGSYQVFFIDEHGKVVTVEDLTRLHILEKVVGR